MTEFSSQDEERRELDREEFSRLLRSTRRAQKLSQAALAKMVKVTPVYISQIETGQRVPSDRVAKDISSALNLPWRDILRLVYTLRSREAGELFAVEEERSPAWRSVSETPAVRFLLMQLVELQLSKTDIAMLIDNWRNDLALLKSQHNNVHQRDTIERDGTATS